MAHARSFRGRGISASQRRKKSWIMVTGPTIGTDGVFGTQQTPNINFAVPASTNAVANLASSSLVIFSDPVLDKVPAESTILRIRGSINLPKNVISAASSTMFALGIGVMEAGAAALGAAPNPATNEGGAWDGWMFFRSQQAASLDANATQFDVKSMRKVQSGQAIIIVVGVQQTFSDGTVFETTAFDAQINLRALILLP